MSLNVFEIRKYSIRNQYSTGDHYAKLAKQGGKFDLVNPGISREFTNGLPEKMKSFLEPNMYAWHSAPNGGKTYGKNLAWLMLELPDGTAMLTLMTALKNNLINKGIFVTVRMSI